MGRYWQGLSVVIIVLVIQLYYHIVYTSGWLEAVTGYSGGQTEVHQAPGDTVGASEDHTGHDEVISQHTIWASEDHTGHDEVISRLCNLSDFNFGKPQDVTIFNDTETWEKCNIDVNLPSNWTGHYVTDTDHFTSPVVHTRCGSIEGRLLSTHSISRVQQPGFRVPNIVHYVVYGTEFTFLSYLSFRSAELFLKPQYIFMHGDGLAEGEWWERVLQDVPNIYHIHWPRISIQGYTDIMLAHMADVIRLVVLQENGGIYLDTDVLVLKSFDILRKQYPLTMGRPTGRTLANSIILSSPNQPFTCVWLQGYRDYDPNRPQAWDCYSVGAASKLSALLPQYVHQEYRTTHHPTWKPKEQLDAMFQGHYDWTNNYSMHIWKTIRPKQTPESPLEIHKLDTTLGEVMRYVYYGNYTARNVCEFCPNHLATSD